MNGLRNIALALSGFLLLAGCQQPNTGTSGSSFTYTPVTGKKLMVELPVSLTPTAPPTMTVAAGSLARGVATTPTSMGYLYLYTFLPLAKTFTPVLAQFGILADAVIVQNQLSPSTAVLSGKTVTVTQALVDQMKAALPAGFALSSTPPLGTLTLPDFVFNLSDNSNFRYSFSMPQAQGTTTIYWNDDKSKVGMKSTISGGPSGTGSSFFFGNDEASQSSSMRIDSTSSTMVIRFKADPVAVASHGVFVSLTSNYTGTYSSSTTLIGYGDDLGGVVDFTSGSGTSASTYRETFNAQGKVTYQAVKSSGLAGSFASTFGTASGTYDAKLGNTDWGSAPLFF